MATPCEEGGSGRTLGDGLLVFRDEEATADGTTEQTSTSSEGEAFNETGRLPVLQRRGLERERHPHKWIAAVMTAGSCSKQAI